jgi:imidazolonepropionase-like amidohydrolase
MGTDAGAYGHGHNAVELRLLTEAGMTPMQAIVASTKMAAACLGLEADLGTLEVGKLADLLVVDGDPIREIGILDEKEKIALVMKGGAVAVDRLTQRRDAFA